MSIAELKQRFAAADPDYGPLPFWWWSAEEITEERILWQLCKFRDGGLRNIGIINIAPDGPQYGSVGDDPVHFSERWWALFGVALLEAQRLGMKLFFYDQIGFSGSNVQARLVNEEPEYAGYALRRFPVDQTLPDGAQLLAESAGYRYAAVRQGFNWLDPEACAALLARVHGEFERRFPEALGQTLGGSFQDELPPLPMWMPELPGRYETRYGEDLMDDLDALFEDRPGCETVRRRVYTLAAEQAEQALFIPLSSWHERHGMLLCCDQAGPARRADVHGAQRLYLDYFRTHRHYSAAGSDMDGEIKPHASMVHLHGGKRVFLESFHTSGWGGTLEETLHWLVPWLQAGATLYSPHSVYYSTRGGWWEWAPPDTGWRQPYYEHYGVFADTISRVCELLSEGVHVADVAVHYPSLAVSGYMKLDDRAIPEHPMVAANRLDDERIRHIHDCYVQITGRNNRREQHQQGALRSRGLDFDIVDDHALAAAVTSEGQLRIAGERFQVLLLCGSMVMTEAALTAVQELLAAGGTVIGIAVPEQERQIPGVIYADDAEEAGELASQLVPRRIEGPGSSLQRRAAGADIYLLLPESGGLLPMHRPADEETQPASPATYRLRTSGEPRLWDPVTGEERPLRWRRDGDWAEVEATFGDWPAALIVSAPPEAWREEGLTACPGRLSEDETEAARTELPSDGWRVQAVPTLDNRYGDFDLHEPRSALLEVERRQVKVRRESGYDEGTTGEASKTLPKESSTVGEQLGWHQDDCDDSQWQDRLWSESAYWQISDSEDFKPDTTREAVYSTVFGDLSFRTWAGRMGRVPRRFLNLGHAELGCQVWARTYVVAPAAGEYYIRTESNASLAGWIGEQPIEWSGGPEEQTACVRLQAGANPLILRATAQADGLIRAAVEVNRQSFELLPKWIGIQAPAPDGSLTWQVQTDAVTSVRLLFAAKGRAILYVNGARVTEHGDFNPYIRQGQEVVDVTALWQAGANELRCVLPEGEGYVFIDGYAEEKDGSRHTVWTGDQWRDDGGEQAIIRHEALLQFAESESLWLTPRPHPLPDVGWLMPQAAGASKPLPLSLMADSDSAAVWLRLPLPAGASGIRLACVAEARLWIGGAEVRLSGGPAAMEATFAPQPAGTLCAIRVEPQSRAASADVLLAPIRFRMETANGRLGDWRSALCLPHHSGAVMYEREITVTHPGQISIGLGHVRGTAEAWLDSQPLGIRAWRPYSFASAAAVPAGVHTLRIRVTNTLGAHYEVGRPTANVGGSMEPRVSYWEPEMNPGRQSSFAAGGLYGPVYIREAGEGR